MKGKICRGEIYLVDLLKNNYHIQSGKRPCLVIQNNLGNIYSPNLIVIPITRKLKKVDMPVHVAINNHQMILCECILTISKEQLIYYIKTLNKKDLKLVDDAIMISLGFNNRRE